MRKYFHLFILLSTLFPQIARAKKLEKHFIPSLISNELPRLCEPLLKIFMTFYGGTVEENPLMADFFIEHNSKRNKRPLRKFKPYKEVRWNKVNL